jgi:DNA polymerase type B, organellar and viral
LLKHLFEFGKVEPIIHNGKIISIKLIIKGENKNDNITIIFKDSYLTLTSSLRNLCTAFNVESSKGHFPYLLYDIDYIGIFPKFEYWTDITHKEWESLKLTHGKRMWSFQQESIKYCELDCESLHQVLISYNENVFKQFKINIHRSLTGPALSMRIFKTHFMPVNTIYQLLGKVEYDLRQSYTGGAVDVYIPHNIKGPVLTKNTKGRYIVLYYYDVNSLYPFVMAYKNMPIGKPIVFEGDIRKIDPEAYGFFYCKITSTNNLEHPILQRIIKTSNGKRTIAGLGTWSGWIYSEEMDNAMKFG